jgi:hypothetical protein
MRRSGQPVTTILNCTVNHVGLKMRKGFVPKRENEPRDLDSGVRHGATL